MMKIEEKAAKMSALVGLWRESGGSKKAFCASHGINVHTFNYWIAKIESEREGADVIPAEKFDFSAIWAMYWLRWRIEIIFKAWKSHLKILQAFKDWQSINPCQTIIRLYLVMAWIVLCLIPAYNYFSYQLYKAQGRHLSLAKFTDYFCSNFFDIIIEANSDKHIPFLKCFCLSMVR